MILHRLLLTLVGCVAIVACGKTPPPPPSPGSSPAEERITGSERLGWDQEPGNAGELASFRYAIYVDGTRFELAGASCATTLSTVGFVCGARLPAIFA